MEAKKNLDTPVSGAGVYKELIDGASKHDDSSSRNLISKSVSVALASNGATAPKINSRASRVADHRMAWHWSSLLLKVITALGIGGVIAWRFSELEGDESPLASTPIMLDAAFIFFLIGDVIDSYLREARGAMYGFGGALVANSASLILDGLAAKEVIPGTASLISTGGLLVSAGAAFWTMPKNVNPKLEKTFPILLGAAGVAVGGVGIAATSVEKINNDIAPGILPLVAFSFGLFMFTGAVKTDWSKFNRASTRDFIVDLISKISTIISLLLMGSAAILAVISSQDDKVPAFDALMPMALAVGSLVVMVTIGKVNEIINLNHAQAAEVKTRAFRNVEKAPSAVGSLISPLLVVEPRDARVLTAFDLTKSNKTHEVTADVMSTLHAAREKAAKEGRQFHTDNAIKPMPSEDTALMEWLKKNGVKFPPTPDEESEAAPAPG